jgi:hypothetical protein
VAKQRKKNSKDPVKKLLAELSKLPNKLARFIQNPDGVMDEENIPRKDRVYVRDAVALKFSKRLVRLMSYHEHH